MSITSAPQDADHLDEFVTAARVRVAAGEALLLTIGDLSVACTSTTARAVLAVLGPDGDGVDHLPAELTTGQVAGLLGVSRPTVVGLVDSGELPASRIGSHRRVRTVDALAYRDRRGSARRVALDALTRSSEDAGLYD